MPILGSARFTRADRLVERSGYNRVFQNNRRFVGRRLVVHVASGATSEPRLGLAIAKRRAPLATARNRIKRLIRESFRQRRAALPALDMVVTARSAAAAADNAELFAELDSLWQRAARSAIA